MEPIRVESEAKDVVICTAGETIDGRSIAAETLEMAADNFSKGLYEVSINYEHWLPGEGRIKALRYQKHPNPNIDKYCLLADIALSEQGLQTLKMHDGSHFSVELRSTKEHGAIITGLALLTNPASIGTSQVRQYAKQDQLPKQPETTPDTDNTPEQFAAMSQEIEDLKKEKADLSLQVVQLKQQRSDEITQINAQPAEPPAKFAIGTQHRQSDRQDFFQQVVASAMEQEGMQVSKSDYGVLGRFASNQYASITAPPAEHSWHQQMALDSGSRVSTRMVNRSEGKVTYFDETMQTISRDKNRNWDSNQSESAQEYRTMPYYSGLNIDWEQIEAWRGVMNIEAELKALWRRKMAIDITRLHFLGKGIASSTNDFTQLDKSFPLLVKEANSGHSIDGWDPGASVILVGNKIERPLDGSPAVDKGSGKVGLPCNGHEFISGGYVLITGTTNYNGKHLLQSDTSSSQLVITASFKSETFSATGSNVVQNPDFANIDLVVNACKQVIPQEYRIDLEVWTSPSLLLSQEAFGYSHVNQTLPEEREKIARMQRFWGGLPTYTQNYMPDGDLYVLMRGNFENLVLRGSTKAENNSQDFKEFAATARSYMHKTHAVKYPKAACVMRNVHYIGT